MGELWGVFCEYLWENWLRYNSTELYLIHWGQVKHNCIIIGSDNGRYNTEDNDRHNFFQVSLDINDSVSYILD